MLFLGLLGAAFGLLFVSLSVDMSISDLTQQELLRSAQREGFIQALQSLAEVMAAVLGLSLAVVMIVVQLAAQRYSPRAAKVFLLDKINLGFFAFVVVSCTYVVILPLVASAEHIPLVAIGVGLTLCVTTFALLMPYVAYVFATLQPGKLVARIQFMAVTALHRLQDTRRPSDALLRDTRHIVADTIGQVSDTGLASIEQMDRHLAMRSFAVLEELVLEYLELKEALPRQWAQADRRVFFMLSDEFFEDIVEGRTWVEAKVLHEFEHAMRRALSHRSYDVISRVAIASRRIGARAAEVGDYDTTDLTLRYFNTYIRHALNAKDVRSVYNIVYQYRLFGLAIMDIFPDMFQRMGEHLVYYANYAKEIGLPFVTVIIAHDFREMCQGALSSQTVLITPVLEQFLKIDEQPEHKMKGEVLSGVRRSQAMLGAFLVHKGRPDLAKKIQDSLSLESRARLQAVVQGIESVTERGFWEISDRGINFDYLDMEIRESLAPFFAPLLKTKRSMSAKA